MNTRRGCLKGLAAVVTRVSHAGQWIEVEYPVKASRDGAQAFGGGIAFAKSWGLRDLLAIEVPDDAEEASGYREARRDARPGSFWPQPFWPTRTRRRPRRSWSWKPKSSCAPRS